MTFSQRSQIAGLLFLLFVIPLLFANQAAGAAVCMLLLLTVFFFSGYLLLAVSGLASAVHLAVCPVLGVVCLTTAYDVFARFSNAAYFFYVVAALAAAGMVAFVLRVRHASESLRVEDYRSVLAGGVAAFCVAPMFWRSGRFSAGEFVFHGPAGQDHLFHVTLLERLLYHVPPDNFMFSGLRATVYHYFGDQTLALLVRVQPALHLGAPDVFDLYYRCYPTLVYFLLGALAYAVGRQILGTTKGGILGVLLLMGAGGLGWIVGILQTLVHAPNLVAMRERIFSSWTSWDGVDAIRPLVHRPAHYNGMLIGLAAISVLLRPDRSRRHWLLAGLLLGLMAGFNFTLAATFGIGAVIASLVLLLRQKKDAARDLGWLALFIFIGSLPVNAGMLLSGFHNMAPGFPFRGPNLEFPTSVWGARLGKILPSALVPLSSLILFPIVAYGIKLFGVGALARMDLAAPDSGDGRNRGLAALLATVFGISFVIGTFFPYQGLEVGIIFLQPTFWILALFALRPIYTWLERNRANWRAICLWGILGLTCVQDLLAFNFSYEETFMPDSVRALEDVHQAAGADDVVAYLPSSITQKGVWSYTQQSTNFAVMAMTGLDGYFSTDTYSEFNAVPGLTGKSRQEVMDKAVHLYEQRRADVESYVKDGATTDVTARLSADHVLWIVVCGDAMREISNPAQPWRKTSEIAVFKLSP